MVYFPVAWNKCQISVQHGVDVFILTKPDLHLCNKQYSNLCPGSIRIYFGVIFLLF